MKQHSIYEIGTFFSTTLDLVHMGLVMNRKRLGILERMEEIMSMCHRNHPVYEQFSSFSVVLYTLGITDGGPFDCPDFLSFGDVDQEGAARILYEHFTEISQDDIPLGYHITANAVTYLLVVGDPLYPRHFAVVANQQSQRPYFSKLPFFGAGFDTLAELKNEFLGIDGIGKEDFHFYKSTCN
ncbi:MAG: hypothetical protein KKD44_19260 [Proteobacteria bacterium]|nr:hypothetical protein [Pseudomonadota bacterium]